MVGLGFQVEECQMRYNADQAATALQGAEDTSSDTVAAIDCYQAEWETTQVQGKKGKQSKYIVFVCVALAIELHEVHVRPCTIQALAVVIALSMLYKVMDHMWGPTEAAKWSMQLAVNYVQLSQADASHRVLEGSNPDST